MGSIKLCFSSHFQLFSYYFPETATWDQYFKLMILVPLIICCQVRELKHLVPFSFLANTMMVVAFGITLYYIFYDIDKVQLADRNMFNGWEGEYFRLAKWQRK